MEAPTDERGEMRNQSRAVQERAGLREEGTRTSVGVVGSVGGSVSRFVQSGISEWTCPTCPTRSVIVSCHRSARTRLSVPEGRIRVGQIVTRDYLTPWQMANAKPCSPHPLGRPEAALYRPSCHRARDGHVTSNFFVCSFEERRPRAWHGRTTAAWDCRKWEWGRR